MSKYISCALENHIATVIINRPDALNALNQEVLTELYAVMDELDHNHAVKAIVLTGAGQKAFVAGADIGAMKSLTPEQAKAFAQLGQKTMDKVANMRPFVIAAVNGYALGGGCELALACDVRVASIKARFGIPEVTLGVIPGFGGTQRLPRLVGPGRAKEMLATGRQVKAEEALQIGLVNTVTEPELLIATCLELAEQVAANSATAIAIGKQAITAGTEMTLEHGLEFEAGLFALTFSTADQSEGMLAFVEKRKAKFH